MEALDSGPDLSCAITQYSARTGQVPLLCRHLCHHAMSFCGSTPPVPACLLSQLSLQTTHAFVPNWYFSVPWSFPFPAWAHKPLSSYWACHHHTHYTLHCHAVYHLVSPVRDRLKFGQVRILLEVGVTRSSLWGENSCDLLRRVPRKASKEMGVDKAEKRTRPGKGTTWSKILAHLTTKNARV
jgi:hypothetical protein